MSKLKMIDSQLGFNQVDIVTELRIVPAQENCDGPDYDLMIAAADYIEELRGEIVKSKISGAKDCLDQIDANIKDLLQSSQSEGNAGIEMSLMFMQKMIGEYKNQAGRN